MICSMASKKLTRLIALSSVLFGTISFVVPKSAYASPSLAGLKFICKQDKANNKLPICKQLLKYTPPPTIDITGDPNSGELYVDFSLNPSVESDDPDSDDKFLFKDAVQSANFLSCPQSDCSQSTLFSFSSGDLKGFLINEDTVQYEATFNKNSTYLGFAIQVYPSGTNFTTDALLDSLSNLNQFLTEYPNEVRIEVQHNNTGAPLTFSTFSPPSWVDVVPEPVPEPDATGSLLVAGATSALLLKRRRHSIKNTHNRTSLERNDTVAVSPCKKS